MLSRLIDGAMDWTVLPGYTRIGYQARERLVPRGPLKLEGRSAIVTGATSGIGEAACLQLAQHGATVHLLVRDRKRGQETLERIVGQSGSEDLKVHRCDLSDLTSVRAFASAFVSSREPLDILVNNAGVLPPQRSHTAEGVELAFATNVLGPFLLTSLLLPALRAAAPSRVINVSSGGMYTARLDVDDPQLERQDFNGSRFYAHTKRAEVVLSEEWARRLVPDGINVYSTHPGWVGTPGVEASLPGFNRIMGPLLRDPAAGADTIIWLAGAPEAEDGNGAFWHDRRQRSKHRVPWTRENEGDGRKLFEYCEHLSGLEVGEADAGPDDQV